MTIPSQNTSLINNQGKISFKVILTLVALATLILILVFAVIIKGKAVKSQQAEKLATGAAAVNVVLYELKPRAISDRLNLPGTVDPWVDLNVIAQVGDTVLEKHVSDGDTVEKNDLLVVIDERKYNNAYQSAAASLESALSSQQRIRSLRKRNLASQADLDTIEATVKKTRAAKDNTALDLARCRIKAPISGTVNKVFIEEGQVISPGQPVARILQIDPVKVTVGIPESDVSAIRSLENFAVTIDALGGRTYSGRKHFLSQTTATNARLYDLDIIIDNPSQKILPDMFVRVDIVKQTRAEAMVLPMYVLTSTDAGHTVYVVENNIARLRKVTPGIQEGFQVEITSGLNFGEHVVIIGQKQIADGQNVNVVRTVTDPEQARL